MKKLTWRLSKLPTPSELTELVNAKIITPDEAKEILVKAETDEERDADSLKDEIKFLRELVENLSKERRTVVKEYITQYVPNYIGSWTQPYLYYCQSNGASAINTLCSGGTTTTGTTGLLNNVFCGASGTSGNSDCSFTAISTF
jgi:hypothetical protein